MTIKFPSFDPGTPGTLLDSENAQEVKWFMEAFNKPTVVVGEKNAVLISDNNVTIMISSADILTALTSQIYDIAYQAAFDRINAESELIRSDVFPIDASEITNFDTAAALAAPVQSVAGKTGTVTLDSGDITDVSTTSVDTCDGTISVLTV